MAKFVSKIISRENIAAGTLLVRLEKPAGFDFTPGQFFYVKLIKPAQDDPKSNMRHFSIVSAPQDDYVAFATRKTGSVFKQTIEKLPVGTSVELKDIDGSFVLPPDPSVPVVFLVGGIGITPVRSMLRWAVVKQPERSIILFYSNRNVAATAFWEEIKNLPMPNFVFVPTMTDVTPEDKWQGETGYIDAAMLKRHLVDLAARYFMLVGPPQFVTAMKSILRDIGIKNKNIQIEEFLGY